jgi:predicted dehydrogenase
MDKVRIGFVGCGTHSTHSLYPMIKYARAQLVSVCDQDLGLAKRNMEIFGGQSSFAFVDELLDHGGIDAVMVVGPAELHYQAGMKALRRGLPTFVEKPTAPDLARVHEMADAARAGHTILMTGFMKRHSMTYGKIRDYIRSGRFIPNSCFIKYTHWPMSVSDLRGMLLGMSSHPIDLMLSFLGRPTRIQCTLGQGAREEATLLVNLAFPQNRVGQLFLGSQVRIQERLEMSGQLDGKPAFFAVDNVDRIELHSQGHSGIDVTQPTLDQIDPQFELEDIQAWRPDYGIPNMGQSRHFIQGFAAEVREFCNAIIEGRQPVPNADDAVETFQVLEAIAANPNGTTELREMKRGSS